MKKLLNYSKEAMNIVIDKLKQLIHDHRSSLLLITIMTLIIWLSILSVVAFLLGFGKMLYVIFPSLMLSLQISIFFYLIIFISRYFIKCIKNQNQHFKVQLNKEKIKLKKGKEKLGKVA